MRLRTILPTTFIVPLFLATHLVAADKPAGVEKEITKIEQEMAAAALKSDVKVFERYCAPDWTNITPDGQVQTWAENSDLWKKGAIKVSAVKLDEVKVKVYSNTALAFVLDTESSTVNGKDTSGQYRWTDVFVKRDGKWVIVATHACKVEK